MKLFNEVSMITWKGMMYIPEEMVTYAESDINNRINKRVENAISDLKLYTDLFDEIVDNV